MSFLEIGNRTYVEDLINAIRILRHFSQAVRENARYYDCENCENTLLCDFCRFPFTLFFFYISSRFARRYDFFSIFVVFN